MRRFVVFVTVLLLLVGVSASVGDQTVLSNDPVCQTEYSYWWGPTKEWVHVSNRGVVTESGVVWKEADIPVPLQTAEWAQWYEYYDALWNLPFWKTEARPYYRPVMLRCYLVKAGGFTLREAHALIEAFEHSH